MGASPASSQHVSQWSSTKDDYEEDDSESIEKHFNSRRMNMTETLLTAARFYAAAPISYLNRFLRVQPTPITT